MRNCRYTQLFYLVELIRSFFSFFDFVFILCCICHLCRIKIQLDFNLMHNTSNKIQYKGHKYKWCKIQQECPTAKEIWERAASPPLVQVDLFIAAVYNRSTVFSRWRQCVHPCNINTIPWGHPIHRPKRQLDRFSRFLPRDAMLARY